MDEFLRFKNKEELAQLVRAIPFDPLTVENLPLVVQRELAAAIDEYLVYGGYPRDVLAESHEQKQEILRDLIMSYFSIRVSGICSSGILAGPISARMPA